MLKGEREIYGEKNYCNIGFGGDTNDGNGMSSVTGRSFLFPPA
jgi:hypothetical protein